MVMGRLSRWLSRWSGTRYRVRAGYLAGALALYFARPSPASLALGLPLALVGEGLRLWAAGHIEKTRCLATGGPYAHTRNPLYVGSMLIAGGLALGSASPWTLGVAVVYVAVFYPAVIRQEAAFLRQKFPADYGPWEREVPLFLPRLRPAGPRSSCFAWRRVLENHEWRAALAIPLALALLYARGRWLP